MTEDETRAEFIDPKLKACGWGVVEGSKVFRNFYVKTPLEARRKLYGLEFEIEFILY